MTNRLPLSATHACRLTLRPLRLDDFGVVYTLASDARVMATLGGVRTALQVGAWLNCELAQLEQYGYCRNVVSHQGEVVGLVGLTRTDFDAGIVPGIEIAWQLAYPHWGQGFATEAAQRVIEDAATRHGITDLIATTSTNNQRSRRVMERLGMHYSPSETFEHPRLPEGDPFRTHVVYRSSARAVSISGE